MTRLLLAGLVLAWLVAAAPHYATLDGAAEPLKTEFNAARGTVRLVMYVSPTCGGCLRGAKETQARVLATVHDTSLRIYVVWAPKNGGRPQDLGKVTQLVTHPRAAPYLDGHRGLTDANDRMVAFSG